MRWEFTITIITIFLQSYFLLALLMYGCGEWRPFEPSKKCCEEEAWVCVEAEREKKKINILLFPSLGSGGDGGRGIMMTWSYLIEFYYFLLFHGKFLCALGRFHVVQCESVELPPIECGASDDLSAWWLKAWDRSRLFLRSPFYCYKYYENYY